MEKAVEWLNNLIWSNALIYLCLGAGLFFTLATRFLQVRYIKEMVKLMFQGKSSEAGISSFQALSMALAGRVGTGISPVWQRPSPPAGREPYSGCG